MEHSTTAHHFEGHLYVHRRGKTLAEFLCERSYLAYFDWGGVQHSAASVYLPRSLAKGTTAWHCHAASSASFQSLKEQGHRGVSIEHHCYDRAKLSSLVELAQAKHALWMQQHLQTAESDPKEPNLDWVVGTGCALHDASKALQWAVARHISYPDLLKDLYVVIESCRSGYDLMEAVMQQFLTKHMETRTDRYDPNIVADYWQVLDVDESWMDMVVGINPFWSDGRLLVSETLDGQAVTLDMVSDCLLYLMKLHKFTETRWLSVGKSCRGLLASVTVGLPHLAAMALKQKVPEAYVCWSSHVYKVSRY